MTIEVRLADAAFDPAAEQARFAASHPEAGAIAGFVGQVRADGGVEELELSHYAPLTLPGMERLGADAMARFECLALMLVHRVGAMPPGEPIVMVLAAATHRRSALEAVDFCMDHLKSAAWFWKRERRGQAWQWIEPRAEDHADLARWQGDI